MNLEEFKVAYYLFDPRLFGRVFAFVDFSNVRHWAKSFWEEENKERIVREVDIEKLSTVIHWIHPLEKRFYYGYWKENENFPREHEKNKKFRNSWFRIDKARKSGFIPRSKEIKEISIFNDDGRFLHTVPKCNFDVEITLDALTQMPKYDSLFLWSGDSDFKELLRYVKSKGKRVITICARDFASDEIERESSLFIPADPLKNFLEYIPNHKNTPGFRREE